MPTPTPESASLSQAIRVLIVARRLTNLAVARAAGISPSVVCRFMNGGVPSGETLDKVAAVLDVRVVEGDGGLQEAAGRRRRASSVGIELMSLDG